MMQSKPRRAAALALAALLAPVAPVAAQQDAAATAQAADVAPAERGSASFSWSSPAIEQFVSQIAGAWRSAQPVDARTGGEQQVPVYVFVSPIQVEGLEDTIYIESAAANALNEPFRQTVAQLRAGERGAVRLRTFEIGSESYRNMVRGIWALDRPLQVISVDGLVPTMDVTLQQQRRGGYAGATEHPYPTLIGDAETMTSEIRLSGDRLVLADRGLDPQGNVVWGPAKNADGYTFERAESPAQRQEAENGLVIIDVGQSDAPTLEPGDQFFANYAGWTAENGLFDSSFYTGRQPIRSRLPEEGQPGNLIQGWLQGLAGAPLDQRRFLIIPSELGYGEQGRPQAGIEPNATLYFAIDLQQIIKPTGQVIREGEPTPPRPEEAEGEAGSQAGNQAGGEQ